MIQANASKRKLILRLPFLWLPFVLVQTILYSGELPDDHYHHIEYPFPVSLEVSGARKMGTLQTHFPKGSSVVGSLCAFSLIFMGVGCASQTLRQEGNIHGMVLAWVASSLVFGFTKYIGKEINHPPLSVQESGTLGKIALENDFRKIALYGKIPSSAAIPLVLRTVPFRVEKVHLVGSESKKELHKIDVSEWKIDLVFEDFSRMTLSSHSLRGF